MNDAEKIGKIEKNKNVIVRNLFSFYFRKLEAEIVDKKYGVTCLYI